MKCAICGKDCKSLGNHISEHKLKVKDYYDMYLRKPNEGYCIICGKDTKFKTLKIGYIGKYCSHSCMYSDKTHFNTKRWKEVRQQKIRTFEIEHNCTFANDLRQKYGNSWYSSNIIPFIYMNSQTKFVENQYITKIIEYASIVRPHYSSSHAEKELVEYIKTFYFGQILENSRKIIRPFELDIYLSDLNLAIEYNGNWYHSIEAGTSKDYHLNKSCLCRDLGIRLIHIYEFENFEEQKLLLKNLILRKDNYPKNDFNKNNLISEIPKAEIIYNKSCTIYGAGKLYSKGEC